MCSYNFKNLRTEKNEPINPTTAPSSKQSTHQYTNGYGDINVIKLDDIIDVIVSEDKQIYNHILISTMAQ